MGLNLVTLAEYKAYAGITSTNQDAQINAIIPKVSQLIKTLCKRAFVDYVEDYKVEYFNGGFTELALSEYPVLQIAAVEYSSDFGNNYTELEEFTEYTLNKKTNNISTVTYDRNGKLTPWPEMVNGYKVTYNAGFETLPDDLKVAVMDTITYYLRNDGAVHANRTTGGNTVQIEYITNASLPAHIHRVLFAYIADFS